MTEPEARDLRTLVLAALTGPEVRLTHDERVRVAADPDRTHVFDAETGDSLR